MKIKTLDLIIIVAGIFLISCIYVCVRASSACTFSKEIIYSRYKYDVDRFGKNNWYDISGNFVLSGKLDMQDSVPSLSSLIFSTKSFTMENWLTKNDLRRLEFDEDSIETDSLSKNDRGSLKLFSVSSALNYYAMLTSKPWDIPYLNNIIPIQIDTIVGIDTSKSYDMTIIARCGNKSDTAYGYLPSLSEQRRIDNDTTYWNKFITKRIGKSFMINPILK